MRIQENISLAPFSTFKIGGQAKFLIEVNSKEDLLEAIDFADQKKVPIFVLGGGSNILISDKGFSGLVIKIQNKGLSWIEQNQDRVEVVSAAGEDWDDLVAATISKNLYGLENLSGIPGTVGAAPVQNVGAYGAEIKDTLNWVEVFNIKKKEFEILSRDNCDFSYRGSIFKNPESKFIITRVSFVLNKKGQVNLSYKDLKEYFKDTPGLLEVRQAVLAIRSRKFPDLKKYGTAGSFFKNPIISEQKFLELKNKYPDLPGFPVIGPSGDSNNYKVSLAFIIDKICGLRGFREGQVGTFENQAIVVVNFGGATSSEVKIFSEKIISKVYEKTGIEIQLEVKII